jgi:hypothetical protein
VRGHVLGSKFAQDYKPETITYEDKFEALVATGSGNLSETKSFRLAPKTSRELYRMVNIVALPGGIAGAYFFEAMAGTCYCTAVGK